MNALLWTTLWFTPFQVMENLLDTLHTATTLYTCAIQWHPHYQLKTWKGVLLCKTHAFSSNGLWVDLSPHRMQLTTLREFSMLQFMNAITDKENWHVKVRISCLLYLPLFIEIGLGS